MGVVIRRDDGERGLEPADREEPVPTAPGPPSTSG